MCQDAREVPGMQDLLDNSQHVRQPEPRKAKKHRVGLADIPQVQEEAGRMTPRRSITGVKHDEVTFHTRHSVKKIGRILQEVLVDRLKASSIDPISSGTGALEVFDDHADIEIVAQGVDLGTLWSVQIYVVDEGETREVTLVALGDGALTRITASAHNSMSLTKSIRKRNVIANALR